MLTTEDIATGNPLAEGVAYARSAAEMATLILVGLTASTRIREQRLQVHRGTDVDKNRAEIQASHAKHIPYGPTNRQAFKSIPADVAARLPSSPEQKAKAFLQNGKWWADNRAMVSERWSQWLLQKG